MPQLSRNQDEARRRLQRIAGSDLTPEAVGARILAAIDVAIPNDGQRLWGIDPVSLLINRLIAASEEAGFYRLRWLRAIYLNPDGDSTPYFAPHELMRASASAVTYHTRQEESWGLPAELRAPVSPSVHHRAFHESLTPAGGSMRLCLRVDQRWIGCLDVVRRESAHPLQSTDFAVLRLVAPVVARALDAALACERALTPDAPPMPPASSWSPPIAASPTPRQRATPGRARSEMLGATVTRRCRRRFGPRLPGREPTAKHVQPPRSSPPRRQVPRASKHRRAARTAWSPSFSRRFVLPRPRQSPSSGPSRRPSGGSSSSSRDALATRSWPRPYAWPSTTSSRTWARLRQARRPEPDGVAGAALPGGLPAGVRAGKLIGRP